MFEFLINPFVLCFLTLPVLTIILSIVLSIILKRKYVVVLVVACVYLIITYTVFNDSFLIWVVVYSIISLITSYLVEKFRS